MLLIFLLTSWAAASTLFSFNCIPTLLGEDGAGKERTDEKYKNILKTWNYCCDHALLSKYNNLVECNMA